jgi:hypothetical protein
MSSSSTARRESAAGAARLRAQRIESCLKSYHRDRAAAVRALAGAHPALADLALSFPALLFALARPRDAAAAARARAAVCAGRSLREAAAEIGLPMWLRALPAQAFVEPLGPLPDGPLFARRVANHLPPAPLAADWLVIVAHAARWGDEAVAVWAAQEFLRAPKSFDAAGLSLVCLWSFFSARPDTEAGRLSRKRWSPRMTFARALDEARDWTQNLELVLWLDERRIDGWLAPGNVGDYAFAPLASAADVIEEGERMRHCVRTYGETLLENSCRLWRVSRAGQTVATVEIGALGRFLTVTQAKARENRLVAPEVERAIHEWLRAQPLTEAPPRDSGRHELRRAVWLKLWRPYWLAKRAFPDFLPLAPSEEALRRLRWGRHRYRRRRRIALPRVAAMI